jgi:hypothetical protein
MPLQAAASLRAEGAAQLDWGLAFDAGQCRAFNAGACQVFGAGGVSHQTALLACWNEGRDRSSIEAQSMPNVHRTHMLR